LQEATIYKALQGKPGIPKLLWSGTEGHFNGMATELLGPSLETLLQACKKPFSLGTTLMIADQMVLS